jgi:glucosamine--fructose-6-phosphate aminotransferase (isomerizing)
MSRMLEEIRQQPDALERTLASELPRIERFKQRLAKRPPRLIVLAARGTSDNAAQFGRYLLEVTTGIPVSLAAPAIHTLYNAHMDYRDALVVGISQSGESTDTNLVLSRAREQGALTIGITNEPSSTLARLAEHVFLVRAGREKSVAATKTYTGQVLMLYLLAYALGGRIRIDDLKRLPERAQMALSLEPAIAELSGRYRFMDHAVVVGRGLNYATAFEFALKMMETCYVVAERFSTALSPWWIPIFRCSRSRPPDPPGTPSPKRWTSSKNCEPRPWSSPTPATPRRRRTPPASSACRANSRSCTRLFRTSFPRSSSRPAWRSRRDSIRTSRAPLQK